MSDNDDRETVGDSLSPPPHDRPVWRDRLMTPVLVLLLAAVVVFFIALFALS